MKVTVWTFTSDTDNGMLTSVHATEREAYERFINSTLDDEADRERATALLDAGDDFAALSTFMEDTAADWLDTFSVESHTLEVEVADQESLLVIEADSKQSALDQAPVAPNGGAWDTSEVSYEVDSDEVE